VRSISHVRRRCVASRPMLDLTYAHVSDDGAYELPTSTWTRLQGGGRLRFAGVPRRPPGERALGSASRGRPLDGGAQRSRCTRHLATAIDCLPLNGWRCCPCLA